MRRSVQDLPPKESSGYCRTVNLRVALRANLVVPGHLLWNRMNLTRISEDLQLRKLSIVQLV